MKNDPKASQAGAETNDWVDQITGSADYEGAVLFFGYAGRSAADPDNSISLYLDAALGKKLDIRKEDILFSRKTTDGNNLEAMLVWTKKSVQHATDAEASPASFLQGDIYNAYLNQNAFPTVPVMSCVTCTGVPFVCSEAPKAGVQAGAQAPIPSIVHACPTVPAASCIVCTGIPLICGQAPQSGLQANAQGAIPTLPVEACIPTMPVISCVTCTGLPFVCSQAPQSAANKGLQGNLQTNIPSMPGFSCVVCPTTPPAGCVSAQGSGLQAQAQTDIPTVPVVSCVTCTGIPIVCSQAPNAAQQGNLQTVFPTITLCSKNPAAQVQGAIPTLPIEACVPTMPVVSCVTCTGIPFVCSQVPNAGQQGTPQTVFPSITHCSQNTTANAQIDIPTMPVVSCVTCTGIPIVCAQAPNAGQQGTPQTVFPSITHCSQNTTANAQIDIPTVPVVSCVTCTGLPFICAQAANSGAQTNLQGTTIFPTLTNCPPPTFAPPFCGRPGAGSGLQAAVQTNMPTQPTSTCFPTMPVTTCYPAPTFVWCQKTGQQSLQANAQGAIPTLPIEACVPTMPVVSCVTCTGIPFVC
ncbi:MAG: hypothetical protein IBJ09_00960 [Bacteroidia bacterium]|nr:hypothetical protein [Bacteroidia bacterium]